MSSSDSEVDPELKVILKRNLVVVTTTTTTTTIQSDTSSEKKKADPRHKCDRFMNVAACCIFGWLFQLPFFLGGFIFCCGIEHVLFCCFPVTMFRQWLVESNYIDVVLLFANFLWGLLMLLSAEFRPYWYIPYIIPTFERMCSFVLHFAIRNWHLNREAGYTYFRPNPDSDTGRYNFVTCWMAPCAVCLGETCTGCCQSCATCCSDYVCCCNDCHIPRGYGVPRDRHVPRSAYYRV